MIKIMNYGEVPNEEIFAREDIASNVEGIVTAIIADVRTRGDEALLEYTARFDKAGKMTFIYLADEIGGFAFHICH